MTKPTFEKKSPTLPLMTFGLLCLSTIILSHLRLTITRNSLTETSTARPQQNWTIWNWNPKQANACGLFLKAVIMVSSPFLPLTSTIFLTFGLVRKNLYYFFPWLLFTIKALFTVQSQNLLHLFDIIVKSSLGCGWEEVGFYAVFIALEIAGGFCYREVFGLFRDLWLSESRTGSDKCLAENEKEEN